MSPSWIFIKAYDSLFIFNILIKFFHFHSNLYIYFSKAYVRFLDMLSDEFCHSLIKVDKDKCDDFGVNLSVDTIILIIPCKKEEYDIIFFHHVFKWADKNKKKMTFWNKNKWTTMVIKPHPIFHLGMYSIPSTLYINNNNCFFAQRIYGN
ncbi:hypothetical protein H8356DRAFT_1431143 [Neocallimastix lanati (nom. inval.)]|nr:hypothetical protein H8356DRAFT_1431143 [Neocallimastix sp. JGI-2020a]